MTVTSRHVLPNSTVFTNRRVVFFPVWCQMISTDVARDELARQLRVQRSASRGVRALARPL